MSWWPNVWAWVCHMHRASNLWQKNLCAPWGSKILPRSKKILQFVCFLGLSPHSRTVVRTFQCYLKFGCVCEAPWYPSSYHDTLRNVNFKYIDENALYAHSMHSIVCWSQLLDNKYGWQQKKKSFSCQISFLPVDSLIQGLPSSQVKDFIFNEIYFN